MVPGKVIQALERVETENPLVLTDDVDKIGRGINGDPTSALLDMHDLQQSSGYFDHYCCVVSSFFPACTDFLLMDSMDLPVDLSRVLFACTANDLDVIPAPLLNCTKFLGVFGYVFEEKEVITLRYLVVEAGGGKRVEKGGRPTRGGTLENKHIKKVRSLRFVRTIYGGPDRFLWIILLHGGAETRPLSW